MQQYSLMFCAIQRKFVVKSFSLSIYYTLVKLRNQVAKECFKARKDLINWIWEELRTMGIMFLLRDWLAASWHELPLAIDYCTNPKIRVKCAKQENKNKSLQLRWSPNELDHQNHVFPMEMNVFDLSVEQLNLAELQRLIVIITRWKIIFFLVRQNFSYNSPVWAVTLTCLHNCPNVACVETQEIYPFAMDG